MLFRSEQGQIELVRSYHGFMQRLTQALDHQQGTVKAAVTREAKARVVLREREVRVASVRKLLERREQQASSDSHRREQKFNDEMASRVVQDSSVQGLASTF